ncbi:hypothetical protein B0J17DRAFT_306211 [Rhizoctonia solani]|nr:hypothetical protein B0J17DRAFT_306211 [Rhizoctonia solani]
MDDNDKRYEGDVYSLAMTILLCRFINNHPLHIVHLTKLMSAQETITGTAPYDGLWNGAAVLKIANGHHPQRPIAHMPHGNEQANILWTLLRECWARDPHDRPTALKVLGRVSPCISSWVLSRYSAREDDRDSIRQLDDWKLSMRTKLR